MRLGLAILETVEFMIKTADKSFHQTTKETPNQKAERYNCHVDTIEKCDRMHKLRKQKLTWPTIAERMGEEFDTQKSRRRNMKGYFEELLQIDPY